MAIPIRLQEALKDSITSGTFVDTKFWILSKRGLKSACVGEPKALFVNGHIARSIPRLSSRATTLQIYPRFQTNLLIVLDKKETEGDLRARFPTDRKPYTNNYEYEDDSDLEEDDDDILDDEPAGAPRVATEESGGNSDVFCVENSDTKENGPSDIISVSDMDSLFSRTSDTKGEAGTASSAHVGKVVVIEDVAFVTWVGFISFRYMH